MAKQTRSPPPAQARPQERHTGVVHIKCLVQQHDRLHHRPAGQRHRLGDLGVAVASRAAARARPSPRSWPPKRPRARCTGARLCAAPKCRSRAPAPAATPPFVQHPAHRHRGRVDQGRHPRSPQWLPAAQAPARLRKDAESWLVTPDPRCASRAVSQPTSSRTRRVARSLSVVPSRPGSTVAPAAVTPAPSTSPRLQEKQKAKYIYGVLERQFKKTYNEAVRLAGPSGENLLRLLEQPSRQRRLSAPAGPRPARRHASS